MQPNKRKTCLLTNKSLLTLTVVVKQLVQKEHHSLIRKEKVVKVQRTKLKEREAQMVLANLKETVMATEMMTVWPTTYWRAAAS